MTQAQRDIRRKMNRPRLRQRARQRRQGVSALRDLAPVLLHWLHAYERRGEAGLIDSRPCPENHKLRTLKPIEDKIVHLRTTYHFGPHKIAWYLERYLGIKISPHGLLPANTRMRSMPSVILYEKQVPGHHVQVDVKFLDFQDPSSHRVRRFQYPAIDDATRIRALKIYEKHNQANAIDFADHVIERFPFRIHTIRTDNGYEFQARFHWHVEDLGIRHVYIKPASPNLNGKVERSHLTDKLEFYQLLDYTDDVDLKEKLAVWEEFYNVHRPDAGLGGRTPYEVLREKMAS